jgi:RimJ/RimL family protein N-acetyltransferase
MTVALPIPTPRLLLRRPRLADADAIFARYSSDPEVTRWLRWPAHREIEETRRFIAWADQQWMEWPAGPLLILEKLDDGREGRLLGAAGLGFSTPDRASAGYLLARDAWRHGYATEALEAVVRLAAQLKVRYLVAFCQAGNTASIHVLLKCGFERAARLEQHSVFPSAASGKRLDVLQFERLL